MLTPYQIELIHGEVDGENSPEASAEARKLVETQPEALALMTSLRGLDSLFREVPERAPSARSIQKVHDAIPYAQRSTQTITGWITQQWNGATNLMGELMSTKKMLIIGTTAVAVIAIIGQLVTGYTPSVSDAGTIGAGDGMSGVQQAGRYKGQKITEKDVTLANPQIVAIFQNDQVLKLVKSEAFHEAMKDQAFRDLTSSDAFHELMSSEAYHELMKDEAYHELMSSETYHELMKDQAFHELMKDQAFHELMSSEAYHELMKDEAYHELMSSETFHELMKDQAFHEIMQNEAFHELMSSETFHEVMKNEAFFMLMKDEAYHELQSNELFRELSHSPALAEAFLNEAMRAEEQ